MHDDAARWTYHVRHTGLTRTYDVIEQSHVTVRGDGIRVMAVVSTDDPAAKRKAERYCRWLQGWDVDEIDARRPAPERGAEPTPRPATQSGRGSERNRPGRF